MFVHEHQSTTDCISELSLDASISVGSFQASLAALMRLHFTLINKKLSIFLLKKKTLKFQPFLLPKVDSDQCDI
jgi:hypothetical protein